MSQPTFRPSWLPPTWLSLTSEGRAVYVEAARVYAVIPAAEGVGSMLGVHGAPNGLAVTEDAPAVFAAITQATR